MDHKRVNLYWKHTNHSSLEKVCIAERIFMEFQICASARSKSIVSSGRVSRRDFWVETSSDVTAAAVGYTHTRFYSSFIMYSFFSFPSWVVSTRKLTKNRYFYHNLFRFLWKQTEMTNWALWPVKLTWYNNTYCFVVERDKSRKTGRKERKIWTVDEITNNYTHFSKNHL